jgi:hypothetical protein
MATAFALRRVAAGRSSTATGSSSSATTRMNHRSTTSSAWPSRCGETFYRAKIGLDGAALVIRLLKRRPLREGRLCGRPRPERPS